MSEKTSRCCKLGCEKEAVWGVSGANDNYDETHACPEHLSELADSFADENWFELYRLKR